MRATIVISFVVLATLCMLPVTEALGRGFGGGGFHGGGFGGFHGGGFGGGDFHASSFHAGGFSGGYGSVQHAGASHYGPATGFTHVGGTSVEGAGGGAYHASYGTAGYASHSANYGSISHYDSAGAYGHAYTYGGYGAGAVHGPEGGSAAAYKTPYSSGVAVKGPAGNEAAAVKGPYGGTAAGYRGPYTSGVAVRGPEGYGAAAVKGPYGGTVAAYHGPYSYGTVAALPSGYTAAAWHGTTYYHSGYSFYQPYYYGGSLYYQSIAAPIGWFFNTLPPAASPLIINNTTYYVADGVYYQPSTQSGQSGYAVVANPAGTATQTPPAAGGGVPDPFVSLQKMSTFLAEQDHFMMQISEVFDEVTPAGEKIQRSSARTIRVARPDKAAADITTSLGAQRRVVYDGKQITVIDQTANAYGIIPVEGPLDVALDTIARDYGMAMPVGDLLYSNVYDRLSPKLRTGQYLGMDKINDNKCDHFAYTQPGISWQVWIDQGDKPVPRRLVISYENTPSRPQYTITVTKWDTRVEGPREFKADIPSGAVLANMVSLAGQIAAGQ